VYVGSPVTDDNLFNEKTGTERPFGRELRMLQNAGYIRQGDYLIPPPE